MKKPSRKKPQEEDSYSIMYCNVSELISHCDQKIDAYFKKLNKDVKKWVKSEVRKNIKR